ncbi:substrate-binding domain-containing protein [Dactylosporangium sp. CA-139066]|uniref:substrate-binding domain-containing protein n=1 Tax=Dactylosporangium sp. CA-139066 TaxID=3239930 RepID=UPI003D8CAA10
MLAAALLVAVVSLAGPARPAAAANYVPISGAGSTWSYNAIHAWIGNVAQFGMRVDYERSGSTTGRAKFRQGIVDWAASDIPYGVQDGVEADPPPQRGFAYMPDTAGGTAFMYNLSVGGHRVTNLRLSGENIAKIFTGVLTRWDDPAIAADNPGLSLPAIAIVPVVRTDGSGSTAQFTKWMTATEGQYWTAYCAAVGRSPCTPTSAYPVLNGSAMVGQAGDLGVSGYVAQAGANGAIGFVEYSSAIQFGFPVAKMLNAAGYYTEPTAGHVAVSLLQAKINMDRSNPATYLTQDLSGVYTNPDPRTYELSSYSYMILPTTTEFGFTTAKGLALGDFGKYALCQGQTQVNALGYSALPINLVLAGFEQLRNVPGAQVPTTTADIVRTCNNPTFSTDGSNTLATNDPQPQACDRQGPTQCASGTGVSTSTSIIGPQLVVVPVGGNVTLTAAVTPATAAGNVQLFDNGAPLAPPVPVVNGTAQLSTTGLGAGTHLITAAFAPYDTATFLPSTSSAVTVNVGETVVADETLNVGVPNSEGVFTMTVSTTPVQMSTAALRADHTFESTGELGPVTINDERDQSRPGWSVSGQLGDFTDGVHTFSGGYLGWAPTVATQNPAHDVTAGPALPSGTPPGLAAGSVLATAPAAAGLGTSTLGATIDLKIPSSTQPGLYSATLTITAIPTA